MGMSLPILLGWAAVSTLLVLIGGDEGNYLPLFVFEIVSMIGYYVSVVTHPTRACWYCKGSGRHNGWLFDYGQRPCSRCDGGKIPRWGTRLFRRGRVT